MTIVWSLGFFNDRNLKELLGCPVTNRDGTKIKDT